MPINCNFSLFTFCHARNILFIFMTLSTNKRFHLTKTVQSFRKCTNTIKHQYSPLSGSKIIWSGVHNLLNIKGRCTIHACKFFHSVETCMALYMKDELFVHKIFQVTKDNEHTLYQLSNKLFKYRNKRSLNWYERIFWHIHVERFETF